MVVIFVAEGLGGISVSMIKQEQIEDDQVSN